MAATGLIFFASLIEYDQRMREDATRNRMVDTLDLFSELRSSEETAGKYLILMLNKLDLFQAKIKEKPLSALFPAYKGKFLLSFFFFSTFRAFTYLSLAI